jgi:hypothetical protein
MLRAVPKSWFSWDFDVLDGAQTVAEIELAWWAEKGRLTVQGASYEVYRKGWWGGAFVLEAGGAVLARAEKPSAFLRSYVIEHAGKRFTLRAESPFGRSFLLVHAPQAIGSLSPEGLFTRRARVDLPEDLPLPLRVFIVWLVLILWRRASHSAAAGAT